jgi:thiamine-monophosphate kinase
MRELGERGLIERVARRFGGDRSVVVGIGDDAAALRLSAAERRADRVLLLASDMVVEGVHFTRDTAPEAIGWKALACNVSDVAAMGGRPRWAVVSLGAPRSAEVAVLDGIARGMARCARRFGMRVVGGDTVRAPQLVLDVAIVGVAARGRLALRSNVRVGDRVFVTGRLGGSLPSGRHARFLPRVAEAQRLVALGVRAMMDLSDGLASDLWQLARASGVRLRVEERRLPVSAAARRLRDGRSPAWHALMDGEDFELLCTAPDRISRRLPAALGRVPLTPIGEVVGRGAGVELVRADGTIQPIRSEGFRHF